MHLDPLLLSRLQWAWVIAWHILLPAFTVGLASYIAVLEGLYFFTGREIWSPHLAGSGPRSSPSRSAWAWCPASSCHSSSAPTGPLLRRDRQRALAADGLRGADGLLPRGGLPRRPAVRPHAGAALGAFLRRADGRLRARCSRRSGSCRPTAGCRRPPATSSSTAASIRPTGWRSSSIRPSPIGSPTTSLRSTSRPASSCSASAPTCLRAQGARGRGAAHDVGWRSACSSCSCRCRSSSATCTASTRCEYQPAKLAAIEGRWDTAQPAPLTLFGIPDEQAAAMRYAIEIPHARQPDPDPDAERRGQGPEGMAGRRAPAGRPVRSSPSASWSGIGVAHAAPWSLAAWWLRWRGRLYRRGWFLRLLPVGGAARLHRRARRLDRRPRSDASPGPSTA